jgi:hypothetical protein
MRSYRLSRLIWLASEEPCSKLLKTALPEWVGHFESRHGKLAKNLLPKLLRISPAQLDRLLRLARVGYAKKGLGATRCLL